MKINADLIEYSARFTNCLKERELDLRGNKIPVVENIAITRDKYDTIDLTSNELRLLNNFPTLTNLKTLYCANNFITRIDGDLNGRLPNLSVLVLTNNRLEDFDSISNLSLFPKLTFVSLIDNVVCKRPNYRLFVISRCPKLKFLDFNKVTQKEREEAYKMFSLKHSIHGEESVKKRLKATVVDPPLSMEHILALKKLIISAESVEEMDRLERIINGGVFNEEVSRILKSQ
jgi:U2 small nuclear ribonucleoprotein A'